MSDQPNAPFCSPGVSPSLHGKEGELLLVRVSVEPRFLEDALETLANLDFPINPQITHGKPTVIEFPAYAPWVPALKSALEAGGLETGHLAVYPMLAAIAAA